MVGGAITILKNMSSSIGIIIPNIWKVIKNMFQTTNQYLFQPSNLPQESNTVKFPGLASNLDSIIQDYTGWGPQDS